jgi:hypothetical protein
MANKTNFGLLVVSTKARNKNIGDYIQSIAQKQFLPRVDDYVQREKLSSYDNNSHTPTALIMNAWYMWHPENWPPSELIIPLPISMHLSPRGSEGMLTSEGIKWFKEHEPIGCRDTETMALLKKYGVDCYFSGCLTLTLHKSFSLISDDKRKGVCFVNPYYPSFKGLKQGLSLLWRALKSPVMTLIIWHKNRAYFECQWNSSMPDRKFRRLKSLCRAACFYQVYSKKFTKKVLLSADFINHTVDTNKYTDDQALFDYANCLIQKYSAQKYVVTSRIHAALPCLSLGTPTIFVSHPDIVGESFNGNRLGGLIDLFHCIRLNRENEFECDDVFNRQTKIDVHFSFANKTTWRKYAEQMIDSCQKFVQQFEG